MIPSLKDDLINLSEKEIYNKYLLGQDVWLFTNDTKVKSAYKKYDELKYYISDNLDIHFNNISIIGSAKTGISFNPAKKFKLFGIDSDLDIILVSQKHYQKFWRAYLDMYYRGIPVPEFDYVNKSIFKGFISLKNPTERHNDIREWVKTVNPFVKDLQMFFGIEREINYRIYNSWEAVEDYHFFGIKQFKNYVLNNLDKEKLISQILKDLIRKKMSTINEQIDIEQHNVKWAIDLMRANSLIVDNTFQRNYVWLQKHQIKLLETILMGFPIPEIYLWQKDTDATSGNTNYSIIDGQQRLGALLNYVSDEFYLKSDLLDKDNTKSPFSGKKFSELDNELKSFIWKFKLSIRLVHESVQREEIVKMFLRLNSTNMTLNPQELRNAEFDGIFLRLAAELSENVFWEDHKIFNPQDIRRMTDIQFISSILMFFRLGISEDTTQENFNRIYDLYNDEYKEKDEDKELFNLTLSESRKIINGDNEIKKFLKKKTHLYSLFLIIYYFLRKQKGVGAKQIQQYKKFVEAYNDSTKLKQFTKTQQSEIAEYKKLSSTGTQGKSNRIRRNEILKGIME